MGSKLLTTVSWEGVGHALWIKHQGDAYLRQGQFLSAYLCYCNVYEFKAVWLTVSPSPSEENIWAAGHVQLWQHSRLSMSFNMTVAFLVGGLAGKYHLSIM